MMEVKATLKVQRFLANRTQISTHQKAESNVGDIKAMDKHGVLVPIEYPARGSGTRYAPSDS
jgi:hypothetical protein